MIVRNDDLPAAKNSVRSVFDLTTSESHSSDAVWKVNDVESFGMMDWSPLMSCCEVDGQDDGN